MTKVPNHCIFEYAGKALREIDSKRKVTIVVNFVDMFRMNNIIHR